MKNLRLVWAVLSLVISLRAQGTPKEVAIGLASNFSEVLRIPSVGISETVWT